MLSIYSFRFFCQIEVTFSTVYQNFTHKIIVDFVVENSFEEKNLVFPEICMRTFLHEKCFYHILLFLKICICKSYFIIQRLWEEYLIATYNLWQQMEESLLDALLQKDE